MHLPVPDNSGTNRYIAINSTHILTALSNAQDIGLIAGFKINAYITRCFRSVLYSHSIQIWYCESDSVEFFNDTLFYWWTGFLRQHCEILNDVGLEPQNHLVAAGNIKEACQNLGDLAQEWYEKGVECAETLGMLQF
jgi:hypothetical protein